MIPRTLFFLEQRTGDTSFSFGAHTLKWVFANEFDLVIVAVYLNISQACAVRNCL
jgi:hypothetical protein